MTIMERMPKFRARIKKVGDNKAESKRWEYFYLWELEDKKIRGSGEIIEFFEQYTGLKDKNGKEIYEGDIVLVANMGRTPYVVIYREGDCSFVANNEALMDYFHLFSGLPKCYEKIGNIHDNPELLEVKK